MRLSLSVLPIVILAGCATAPSQVSVTGHKLHQETAAAGLNIPGYPIAKGLFTWPLRGEVTSFYGSKANRVINKGIDIRAAEGTDVKAARAGRVVYCDPYLRGFGKTLIIDHGGNLQTVYAYNSEILVKVGDEVRQNQIIARVGRTGRAKAPALHFEIRTDGEPQNPFYYLPR